MSQIVSFEQYRPVPRFDDVPWTQAVVEEGASEDGPWLVIDTLMLDPIDADPADPQVRNLTTEMASDLPALWYRITFWDAGNESSQPTEPRQNFASATAGNVLSRYALCEIEDVVDLLGYDENQAMARRRTIIRAINSASRAITRRSQREFLIPPEERHQTRYQRIDAADVLRGFVRVGDLRSAPDAVSLWSPDRDSSFGYDVNADIILLPDAREPGFPYAHVKVKSSATNQPMVGWWLCVEGDWGFPSVPDDIIQIAIAVSASFIWNDAMKLTELARQSGRRVTFDALIPAEFEPEIDSYRLFRVA